MNEIIEEIFSTGHVRDRFGNPHRLIDNIDRTEGKYLSSLITADTTIKKTLEIGCAQGISSLFICDALSNREPAKHVIIDPFQLRDYQGIGLDNLARAGFSCYEFIEELSESALPVLAKNEAGTFDMIFIDGWHTFDHTLLDMFYANLLLRVGGYVVIDDCRLLPVSKAVSYFANYPAYRIWSQLKYDPSEYPFKRRVILNLTCWLAHPQLHKILSMAVPKVIYDGHFARFKYQSMVALRKIDEDRRSWSWFEIS